MEAEFIERIDDSDSFLRREGLVQTDSNEQAYGVIRALSDWNPLVTIVTEEYFPEAVAIMARIGEVDPLQPNALETMAFDAAAWTNKLDAYPYWETAWWREVIQNASDARGPEKPHGATRVELECYPETYTDIEGVTVEAMRVSATDDGVGMSEDTLRNAFLKWSGSQKPEGSTGGFGDAKELIIIPWLGYEVHTRDKLARGRHNEFEVIDADYLDGTRVTAWMPLSKATTPAYAEGFIDRCYLPNLRITINGKVRKANLTSDSLVIDSPIRNYSGDNVGTVRIFHNARTRRRGVLVRSNGVFMFDKYVDPSKYKGAVLIELTGEPRALYDQKRVNFSYASDVRDIVDTFIARMTVDVRSALKKQRADKGKVRQLYVGTGALQVQKGAAAEVAAEMAMDSPVSEQKQWKDGSVSFGGDAIESIVKKITEQSEEEDPRTTTDEHGRVIGGLGGTRAPRIMVTSPQAVEVILNSTRFASAEHAADALRLMAWQPIFLLVNEVDFFTVPGDVTPEKMKPTYKKLAELWMEICRFTLMRLGWNKAFGVGWIFDWDDEQDSSTLAAYTQERDDAGDAIDFLLLNPVKLLKDNTRYDKDGDVINITYKKQVRWKSTDDKTLQMLCAIAVHECTHMINGISEHNEAFTSAMTENMGTMFDMLPVAKKIRNAVSAKAREETEERGPSRAAVNKRAKELGLSWTSGSEYSTGFVNGTRRFDAYYDSYDQTYYLSDEVGGPPSTVADLKSLADAKAEGAKRIVDEAGGMPKKRRTSKRAAAEKPAVEKTSLVDEVTPKDTGDPMFYRLWALFLYAWARHPDLVRDSSYEATLYARSLGSEVAGSGRPTESVVTTAMQKIIEEPERYALDSPSLPIKLPAKAVRDLEWDGREAWNIFVISAKVGGPMSWDDFERKRLARAVGAVYDLKTLAQSRSA